MNVAGHQHAIWITDVPPPLMSGDHQVGCPAGVLWRVNSYHRPDRYDKKARYDQKGYHRPQNLYAPRPEDLLGLRHSIAPRPVSQAAVADPGCDHQKKHRGDY